MAKAPLFKNKIAGAILKGMGAYPVDNKSATGDITAIKTTMKHLKKKERFAFFQKEQD